ncbi:MAG: hypothetical protein B9S38_15215 [Verrucomicrobiia bacterium Tous-C4TDCM]|nr:MAG: hypothetical protein B9S38_15215 [Verrucomicrobiae bacterium Tous-C4TDCM]
MVRDDMDTTTKKVDEFPEWVREKTATAQFGIGRQTLRRLRTEGKIRAVSLREPGCKRGIALYCPESIRAFIAKMEGAAL